MPFTNSAKHVMLNALAATLDEVSVHDADPGTTGTDELSGGSYVRLAPTFAAASGGEKRFNELVFDIPTGASAAYFGLWDGATFMGAVAVPGGPLSFPAGGTLTMLNTSKLDINDS